MGVHQLMVVGQESVSTEGSRSLGCITSGWSVMGMHQLWVVCQECPARRSINSMHQLRMFARCVRQGCPSRGVSLQQQSANHLFYYHHYCFLSLLLLVLLF